MTDDGTTALIGSAGGRRRCYLLRALVGRELVAEGQLRRQEFSTFLPKQMKTVRHARRLRVTLSAFFPGYLFVRLDLARDRWRSVNGTLGVALHDAGRVRVLLDMMGAAAPIEIRREYLAAAV